MGLLQDRPRRMLEEYRGLTALARAERWFELGKWRPLDDGGLAVSFRLTIFAKTFDGVLGYPGFFPDTPAYIEPRTKGESWSSHQYGNGRGVLCLEYGPDNWHPGVTGVDLLLSLKKLVTSEVVAEALKTRANTSSRHEEGLGARLRFEFFRFVQTRELRNLCRGAIDGATVSIRVRMDLVGGSMRAIVTHWGDDGTPLTDLPAELDELGLQREGWVVCDSRLARVPKAAKPDLVRRYLDRIGRWPSDVPLPEGESRGLMLLTPGGTPRFFLVSGGAEPSLTEYTLADFSSDDARRLPAEFADIGEAPVAVVGLGSVGSKVAVSLARSGVRRFLLIDDDVLAPQNLVRHQLTWRGVGAHKVDAIEAELKLVAPGVSVAAKQWRVGGQENPKVAAEVLELLSGCRLVVDATADARVFTTLAAVCRRAGSIMVWGELFPGGGGGLMARSRPGLDGDALSVRSHINASLAELPPAPDKRARSYDDAENGAVVVAGDADVSAVAASMTQFALDALLPAAQSQYPFAAYLMGYKKYWVFDQPFVTLPIDCSGASEPNGPETPLTEEDNDALAQFATMVGKA